MTRPEIHIGIIESSRIICEGIHSLLLKSESNVRVTLINDIENINLHEPHLSLDIIIINASQIMNRMKLMRNLKCNHPEMKWFGLIFTAYEHDIVAFFDETIGIDDTLESIHKKLSKHLSRNGTAQQRTETLSGREIEILKEIVRGMSNKQIADRLNISINTVMSHRKNISQKTNIKSQAGLTVFALTNNIISIDTI